MNNHRLGHCYELAGRELIDTDLLNPILVHGVVGEKERNPHAWVEHDMELEGPPGERSLLRMVWEPVSESELPLDAFLRLFQAEALFSYDQTNALKWMASTKHWGPWEGEYWVTEKRGRQKLVKGKTP